MWNTYTRRVGPQGPNRWSAEWWKYPEAISRLDALAVLGGAAPRADVRDERVVA